MNILLIQPSQLNPDGTVFKSKGAWIPSLTLPYIAALTPPYFKVKIIDEYVNEVNFDTECDLIGITAMRPQAVRAYQIAEEFRKKDKTVVMGGFHASLNPYEAKQHCDSVVIGEAEYVWQELLRDVQKGHLKSFYKSDKLHDLKGLPAPRFDLLGLKRYKMPALPVQATRGCLFSCEFCSVTQFYGRTHRYRPIEDVVRDVEDIRRKKVKRVFFVDDNITINRNYAKQLFKALIPLKIQWLSQCNISIGNDIELLKLARKSGCFLLYIGIESISSENLKSINKNFNPVKDYDKLLKAIRKNGIAVDASLMFGLDYDDQTVFQNTLEFLLKNKVQFASFFILTPTPGTKLFDRFEKEGRIISKDWSKYTGFNVVYKPKRLTPGELESGFWYIQKKFYSLPSILKRSFLPLSRNSWVILYKNLLSRKSVNKKHHPMMG